MVRENIDISFESIRVRDAFIHTEKLDEGHLDLMLRENLMNGGAFIGDIKSSGRLRQEFLQQKWVCDESDHDMSVLSARFVRRGVSGSFTVCLKRDEEAGCDYISDLTVTTDSETTKDDTDL